MELSTSAIPLIAIDVCLNEQLNTVYTQQFVSAATLSSVKYRRPSPEERGICPCEVPEKRSGGDDGLQGEHSRAGKEDRGMES